MHTHTGTHSDHADATHQEAADFLFCHKIVTYLLTDTGKETRLLVLPTQ